MSCVLCGSEDLTTVSSEDAKSKASLNVGMCGRCGLIQQDPMPTPEELVNYYSHEYRVDYKSTYTPKPKHVYRAARTAKKRIAFLAGMGVQSGRLIDIGAGGGEFVYIAGKIGFDASGLEPNIGYANFSKAEYGINIDVGGIDAIHGKYDVITMFHVLEHLPSPVAAFKKLHEHLNAGGFVFIEVPWIETQDASPHNIYFKAHTVYFSVETLKAAASEHFDVVDVDTSSNLRIVFRLKDVQSELVLPTPDSVRALRKRINAKGWFEYLLFGNGWAKPFQKLARAIDERKVRGFKAKKIIDEMVS